MRDRCRSIHPVLCRRECRVSGCNEGEHEYDSPLDDEYKDCRRPRFSIRVLGGGDINEWQRQLVAGTNALTSSSNSNRGGNSNGGAGTITPGNDQRDNTAADRGGNSKGGARSKIPLINDQPNNTAANRGGNSSGGEKDEEITVIEVINPQVNDNINTPGGGDTVGDSIVVADNSEANANRGDESGATDAGQGTVDPRQGTVDPTRNQNEGGGSG